MKGFILDSTFKENIIIDNNQTLTTISCNNILNSSKKTYNLPLDQFNSSYLSHTSNISKYNTYNLIDYL